MSVIRFSINNPLIVNLSLFIILVMGMISWWSLPQEIFPEISLDLIRIATEFEGASPEEVEQQITLAVEEAFKNSDDIDYISSASSEGLSSVYVKLKHGANFDDFIRDARTSLDQLDNLPDIAEEPELNRLRARFPVITLTLYGGVTKAELYTLAEKVRRRLQQVEGVASVGVAGDRNWEIWVEINPHRLAALNISLQEVINAIRNNLQDQPGGSIKSREGDIRLRGLGAVPEPAAIENIVLRTQTGGGQLLLGNIAKVGRHFEEAKTYARFNGQPAVNLTVTKTAKASTTEVANAVKALLDKLKPTLPSNVLANYHTDLSTYIKIRLNTVKSSGLVGLTLLLLSLYLLLNFRIAAITAFGIPVSFIVAIIGLYCLGFTINMVSLFAFLVVLGMIVDDAIIVTENIYRHIEFGKQNMAAAQIGAREVFWPVVVSTLTTIAAFLPMLAIGGILGEFIKVIPVVVCCALLGSLLEAFLILPSHAAHLLKRKNENINFIHWQNILAKYCNLLRWCALNRYLIALISICILAISLTYAQTRLRFELFGNIEIGQFFINIETPSTYSLEDTSGLAATLEQSVHEIIGKDEMNTLLTNVGISFIDDNQFITGSNLLQMVVDLKKPVPRGFIETWIAPLVNLSFSNEGTRKRSSEEIINAVREEIVKTPGIKRMNILRQDAGPAGADIEVGVVGSDISVLRDKVNAMQDYLRRIPGVKDVRHDQDIGKLEYQYSLNEKGRRLGLTQVQLASAVRSGYLGSKLVYVTWQEKRIPVRLIYPQHLRQQSTSLAELPIILPTGRTVYLGDVADITIGHGLNQIRRRDGQRMVKVLAAVDSTVITAAQVTAQLEEVFQSDEGADYRLLLLGEKRDAAEAFKGINKALIIALVIIFFMLAALFKSLIDPIVVIVTIPFGAIGIIFGHVVFSYHLQFISAVGGLALAGIIVNDSLILVDFIKRMRAEGKDRISAVIEAGRVRARPILLTTITTCLGVSPMIFFATGQVAFLSPMAISLGFGLIFATFIILLALPSFYLIADDCRTLLLGPAYKKVVTDS